MAGLAVQDPRDDAPSSTDQKSGQRVGFAQLDIALIDDMNDIEAEWRRLEAGEWLSLNQSFEWCRSWQESHGTELVVVSGAIGPKIMFILPLEICHETLGRIARLPGGRFNNVNTGLFDPDLRAPDEEELRFFRAALARALSGKADLLVFDQVPPEWRGVVHPLAGLASIENQNRTFQLPLCATMEATLSQINAKTRRKKYRTQVRRMDAIGGFEHIVAADADEQHRLLDVFFAQKGARLKMLGLPDVFASAPTRRFFHQLLDSPAHGTNKALVMHAIRLKGAHEGHIAAVTGLSRKGGHVLCQFSSIDESIGADASPGELLFWFAVQHSIEEGASLFDFGVGDQPYKRSWCSQETAQQDILLPISKRGALLAPVLIARTRIKAAVKRHHRLYALAQRWRSRHGHPGR
jgi:CelD/BcsL family acetyltransferase involved in cellulose biosynthesis